MKTVVNNLFGWLNRGPGADGNSTEADTRSPQHSVLHDGSETAARGQLVQVLLRDLVRKSGIPAGWIECQIQVVNSRSRGQGIYVRLIIKHWDKNLLKYAFAVQNALLKDIVQFEPLATNWLHGVSWELEVAGSCPFTELPDPQFWQQLAAKQSADPFDIVPMPASAAAAVAEVIPPAPAVDAATAETASPEPMAEVPTLTALPELLTTTATDTLPTEALQDLPDLQDLPSLDLMPDAAADDTAQDLERLFAIRDKELAPKTASI